MEDLQGLPASEARRFRSGRICIDLVHTGGEGDLARWELLHTEDDVAHWLGRMTGATLAAAPGDVAATRALRGAIWDAASARAAGREAPAAAVAAINAAAAEPPLAPRLDDAGRAGLAPGTVAQARATLARDAIDLLGGPLGHRIRACAAGDCGLLFVDASRPGRRRWCSMEWCGNRAKMRARSGARRAG
jgi:predicted RNA-binding Zn ribbon-like protein